MVYLAGLKDHRSLYHNSIVITSILSIVFFAFIFIGLFSGWKLKDTLGNLTTHFSKLKKPGNTSVGFDTMEIPDIGEGAEGCIISLLLWLIIGLFGTIILWFIGAFFWAMILILGGLLYWILFRAYRLIFRNSKNCKGNFFKSFQIALAYSILYVSWIYAIIFIGHYFSK
jgi:hypothetical protein